MLDQTHFKDALSKLETLLVTFSNDVLGFDGTDLEKTILPARGEAIYTITRQLPVGYSEKDEEETGENFEIFTKFTYNFSLDSPRNTFTFSLEEKNTLYFTSMKPYQVQEAEKV